MKDRLAIFDLDGTLVDTIRANYEAYRAVAIEFGKTWSISEKEFEEKYFGKSYKIFLPEIAQANLGECRKMHIRKEEIYYEFLRKYGRMNDSLISICRGISSSCYVALVTTASRKNTEKAVELFLRDIDFDIIITGDDVTKLKPDTEAWDRAREFFGISRAKTTVFDDQREYINAAVKAGMNSYQVFMAGDNYD